MAKVSNNRTSLEMLIKCKLYPTETTKSKTSGGKEKSVVKPLEDKEFLLGYYTNEDVENALNVLKDYQKKNKEWFNKQKEDKEKNKGINKIRKVFDDASEESKDAFMLDMLISKGMSETDAKKLLNMK